MPIAGVEIEDVHVHTLCRSDDEDPGELARYDRVDNNTDFKDIFEDNAAYFFRNDLPAELGKGYQNSHWDAKTIRLGEFKYRSTIVWPVAKPRPFGPHERERREIIGFLCVDSIETNTFNETYDVPIGMAFSGMLHVALSRFRARRIGLES